MDSSTPLPTEPMGLAGDRGIDTVVQKQHLCRFPKHEKQPSLDRSLREAAGFGNSPAPCSRSDWWEL